MYELCGNSACLTDTVFPRSNAATTIYFITRFTAATIRGRPLIEGGVY